MTSQEPAEANAAATGGGDHEPADGVEPDQAVEPGHAAETDRAVAERAGNRRLLTLFAVLATTIAALDQLTKYLAETHLEVGGSPIPILGDLLSLTLVYNPGAAFSFGTGVTWVFTIVMVVVSVAVVVSVRRLGSLPWAIALGALLGGAVGNLIDRLFREPGFGVGHVVDFINYGDLFVGNVSDIAIVGAAIGIALLAVGGRGLDGTRVANGRAADAADADADAESGAERDG